MSSRYLRYGLILSFILFLVWFSRGVAVDDSFIYDRYIRNALQGKGLVFNIGEHVNALSSPLYCYLLLGVAKVLHHNVLEAARLLFIVSFFGACILAENLGRWSGVLLASYTYFYALQGMETSLFVFFLALSLYLYDRQKWNWLPLSFVLLVLTRFEGGLLVVILFGAQIARRKLPSLVSLIPAIAFAGIYLWFNLHWYGKLLPSSAGAKLGQGVSGYWGRWPTAFLRPGALLKVGAVQHTLLLVPFGIALSAWGFWKKSKVPGSWVWLAVYFMAGLGCFYVLFNLPAYAWYFGPFMFFGLIFASLALPSSARVDIALATFAVLLCLYSATVLRTFHQHEGYAAADAWLLEHAPSGVRVATVETGLIGWQLENDYIIDIIGLTTPKNAKYLEEHQPGRWLDEDRPDYIVVHEPLAVWEKVLSESPDYYPLPIRFGDIGLYARRGAPMN